MYCVRFVWSGLSAFCFFTWLLQVQGISSSVNMLSATPDICECHPSITTLHVSLWGVAKNFLRPCFLLEPFEVCIRGVQNYVSCFEKALCKMLPTIGGLRIKNGMSL